MAFEFLIAQKAAKMLAAGFPSGLPTGALTAVAGGEYQLFENALISSHPSGGTFEVHGAILSRYLRMGGPGGRFGYPVTDEVVGGDARYSRFSFQGSGLVWHPTNGVHEVHGLIGETYWGSGGVIGIWGVPLSDEYPDGGGRSSDFRNGTITWSSTSGILEIYAPPVTPAGGDWAGASRNERAAYAVLQLVERYGYPMEGAAGLVGNLVAESWGVIPACVEGSSEAHPMRARNHAGQLQDFTPSEVMNRDVTTGPSKPGAGIAQWTTPARRRGLFTHAYHGASYGAENLRSMDTQLDYLVAELGGSYSAVDALLRRSNSVVESASDEVVYRFEVPGAILDGSGHLLPRNDPRVVAVFGTRRRLGHAALRAYQSSVAS